MRFPHKILIGEALGLRWGKSRRPRSIRQLPQKGLRHGLIDFRIIADKLSGVGERGEDTCPR